MRVAASRRATKPLKDKTPDVKQATTNKTKRKKDTWEMSAKEALLVNFVVSEI